ncbi:UDP-glucose 4-epimerase GalE, partial [Candidatus Pelagibacter sp.]|nr:UDP-glucose 4-epimerase GalE [Candidatus Pelagibacter sp.]
ILKKNIIKKGLKIYNFGTGKGSSVLEVIKAFEKQTGKKVPYKFAKRRKGDATSSICSPKKAIKELKWKAKFNLNQSMMDMIKII